MEGLERREELYDTGKLSYRLLAALLPTLVALVCSDGLILLPPAIRANAECGSKRFCKCGLPRHFLQRILGHGQDRPLQNSAQGSCVALFLASLSAVALTRAV
jgi:hypothetical protein